MIRLRWLGRLVVPGVWLLLAAWGLLHWDPARTLTLPYARFFCYGALAAAALLSWYYNRGRVLFVTIAVALTVWSLEQLAGAGEVAKLAGVFLLPLNFALFVWLPERGVVSPSGIFKSGLLAAQVLAVVIVGEIRGGRLEAFLRWGERPGGWTWMPLTEQLAFAAGALALLALLLRRWTKLESGLLWALAAVFLAVTQARQTEVLHFYSAAAGLILLFAVLEHGYEVAYRDELTGLPGRRAFNEALVHLDSRYAIAMCDVDHFKELNDTYGHEVGDQVLRMVAAKLSRVEGGGRAFRYGGEEFTLLFPHRSAKDVQPYVESLRQTVAGTAFALRGPDRPPKKPERTPETKPKKTVSITISIGVAESTKRQSNPDLVLDAADKALYQAKESGRDCVRLA